NPHAIIEVGGARMSVVEAERLLRSATGDEASALRAAIDAAPKITREPIWNDGVQGGDGSSGDPNATALYRRLYDDLNDRIGGDENWLNRLDIAADGLVFVPDPEQTPAQQGQAERAHRTRVARYIAYTIRQAGEGNTGQMDLGAVMSLIGPDTPPGT